VGLVWAEDDVPAAKGWGAFPPVCGSVHQIFQPIVWLVVIESFRPQVTRISQHNFAALKQNRMIVRGIRGEPRVDRQRPNGCADRIESRALHESKARLPASQTTNQTHKSPT